VEGLQRLAFPFHGLAIARRQLLVRIKDHSTIADRPAGDHPSIDEHRPDRERVAAAEDAGPIGFRQEARATGVDEQAGVPVRQEADRRRCRGVGQRRVGQIDELATVLVAKPPQREVIAGPLRIDNGDACPRGDVAPRRGPNARR
jgi:hypothetical protein